MLIRVRHSSQPAASEITPRAVFRERRRLLAAAGFAAAGLAAGAPGAARAQKAPAEGSLPKLPGKPSPLSAMERQTSWQDATTYNNFYEFGTDKSDPARYAGSLQ
ncbi:MAG: protein-methionine-sulfoxide reductase catalytic subunit MsrP, partial [Lautropia sp.]|nr:protein-methionine-sulfoxide reductase catalytic subunit MsrP [Lautropia sp.]